MNLVLLPLAAVVVVGLFVVAWWLRPVVGFVDSLLDRLGAWIAARLRRYPPRGAEMPLECPTASASEKGELFPIAVLVDDYRRLHSGVSVRTACELLKVSKTEYYRQRAARKALGHVGTRWDTLGH